MSVSPQARRNEIQRYMALDVEELYAVIPAYLPEYDGVLFSPQGQISAGKRYIESLSGKLRKSVCEDFDWPSKRDNAEFDDTLNLIAAVADVIAVHITSVPPVLISVLLVKRGLDRLCHGSGPDSQ
jgi:hypothetical protein